MNNKFSKLFYFILSILYLSCPATAMDCNEIEELGMNFALMLVNHIDCNETNTPAKTDDKIIKEPLKPQSTEIRGASKEVFKSIVYGGKIVCNALLVLEIFEAFTEPQSKLNRAFVYTGAYYGLSKIYDRL